MQGQWSDQNHKVKKNRIKSKLTHTRLKSFHFAGNLQNCIFSKSVILFHLIFFTDCDFLPTLALSWVSVMLTAQHFTNRFAKTNLDTVLARSESVRQPYIGSSGWLHGRQHYTISETTAIGETTPGPRAAAQR